MVVVEASWWWVVGLAPASGAGLLVFFSSSCWRRCVRLRPTPCCVGRHLLALRAAGRKR